jgi:hypothetical protein
LVTTKGEQQQQLTAAVAAAKAARKAATSKYYQTQAKIQETLAHKTNMINNQAQIKLNMMFS